MFFCSIRGKSRSLKMVLWQRIGELQQTEKADPYHNHDNSFAGRRDFVVSKPQAEIVRNLIGILLFFKIKREGFETDSEGEEDDCQRKSLQHANYCALCTEIFPWQSFQLKENFYMINLRKLFY